MGKTAVAFRHVHFEDLGTFAAVLTEAGYGIRYHDLGAAEPVLPDPDLLLVLGGPVGVYETEVYPFLSEERRVLARRLAADRPTLGICLGAQQMAATLGARVSPTGIKEIGFSELTLTDAGKAGPLQHLRGVPVLHWHGDAFEIPAGAENLATTPLCGTQGFALGRHILGLQFHAEVDARGCIESWLVGHAAELAAARIDPRGLREGAMRCGPALRDAARRMLNEWLQQLDD